MWRKMVIDAIRDDPEWKNGEYTAQPQDALKIGAEMFYIAAGSALQMQKSFPTREATDAASAEFVKRFAASHDANDLLYAMNASWDYDPSAQLEKDYRSCNIRQFSRRFHQSSRTGYCRT